LNATADALAATWTNMLSSRTGRFHDYDSMIYGDVAILFQTLRPQARKLRLDRDHPRRAVATESDSQRLQDAKRRRLEDVSRTALDCLIQMLIHIMGDGVKRIRQPGDSIMWGFGGLKLWVALIPKRGVVIPNGVHAHRRRSQVRIPDPACRSGSRAAPAA